LTLRTWLCKCQQRNQRAGNSNNCFLHHNVSYVLLNKVLELVWLGQEPLGVFAIDHFYLSRAARSVASGLSELRQIRMIELEQLTTAKGEQPFETNVV